MGKSEAMERLECLHEDFKSLQEELPDRMEDVETQSQEGEVKDEYIEILSEFTAIIEVAEEEKAEDLEAIIQKADDIFSEAIAFADANDNDHSAIQLFYAMHSFAHNDETRPLLCHERKENTVSHYFSNSVMKDFFSFFQIDPERIAEAKKKFRLPPSWKTTLRPHPRSNPCARFTDKVVETSLPGNVPRANFVFQARCEVQPTDINQPSGVCISNDGKGFVTSTFGGWKRRDPYIRYHSFVGGRGTFSVGLGNLTETCFDHDKFLIAAGDWDRIKTYIRRGEEDKAKMRPLHTMASKDYTGAMSFLPNNRLARCGKGQLAIWNLDDLPTHGPSGKDIIGSGIDEDDLNTWRMTEDVERSSGSQHHTTQPLAWTDHIIKKWHPHPSQTNVMLCASDPKDSKQYRCHAIDIENEGKIVARYLGIGGAVDSFATSRGDPNVFAVSSDDGYTRLYDTRRPLPVVTIKAPEVDSMRTAALCHPDGHPFLFIGSDKEECIRLWDLRARIPVYELATGNNSVVAMTWNDEANELYAITEWVYSDRHEGPDGYRVGKVPPPQSNTEGDNEDDDMEDEEEDEEEDPDPYNKWVKDEWERMWPARAFHAENYFGHTFDMGCHAVLRYRFTENPDPQALPAW
ncbi:hypothetical protein CC1G_06269 [Coprinopsis cinerea okayama7|uniref:WD40 repeat-like protein n=1 Tax=Coprinopsis cinerea (strain Okayama-7 / 130 / ATCC MYA-4618 / FGSC 9003) TaxID=240176 RepID=A8NTA7_COPC7|nr:hypothetical protein CC1G_06269 [Coprinopsis cinerea okayama7\|eukprot:XP_001836184.1 hypothetical protein CC1G_06269 [Coprinopsis cinerea okayama7\